jgi:site-specific DNA recombinase
MFASIFADLERETIIARVKGGMSQKATQGGWNGGIPPLGYDSIDKQLIVNKEEKKIVEFIFSEYLQGNGYLAIVDKLKEKGYRTKKYITKKGKIKDSKNFSINTVKGILQNNTYKGYIRWGYRKDWGKKDKHGKRKRKYDENPILKKGIHDAIIAEEIFDKVQDMIKNNPRHHFKRFNGNHLLSGLLRCPVCGSGMSYQPVKSKGKLYEYYTCNTYQNKKECKPNNIRKNRIEEEFFLILDKIINEKDFQNMMKEFASISSTQVKEVEESISRKEKEIEQLNRKIDNLLEYIAEGTEKVQDSFMDKINKYSLEADALQESIKKDKSAIIELESESLDVNAVMETIEKAGKVIQIIEDKEAKQRLVRKLIKKIETKDKHICKIHLTFGGIIDVLGLNEERRTLS